jgi:hypothetical protein
MSYKMSSNIEMCEYKEIESLHSSPINCLNIDNSEYK